MKIQTICKHYDDEDYQIPSRDYDDYDVESDAQAGWDMIACDCGFDGCDDVDGLMEWLGY